VTRRLFRCPFTCCGRHSVALLESGCGKLTIPCAITVGGVRKVVLRYVFHWCSRPVVV